VPKMRQLLSLWVDGGGSPQDNFVNAAGESAPIEVAIFSLPFAGDSC